MEEPSGMEPIPPNPRLPRIPRTPGSASRSQSQPIERDDGMAPPLQCGAVFKEPATLERSHPMKKNERHPNRLARNSLQLRGIDSRGRADVKKSLRRERLAAFFANLPSCLAGMEACASSAYWARVLEFCGREARRMFARSHGRQMYALRKMRFVPHKSQDQAGIQAIHRVRRGLAQARMAAINQVRGLLAENGIVIRQGA